ncbi:uncharacterized protein LOC100176024 [Ciona intestinalis]
MMDRDDGVVLAHRDVSSIDGKLQLMCVESDLLNVVKAVWNTGDAPTTVLPFPMRKKFPIVLYAIPDEGLLSLLVTCSISVFGNKKHTKFLQKLALDNLSKFPRDFLAWFKSKHKEMVLDFESLSLNIRSGFNMNNNQLKFLLFLLCHLLLRPIVLYSEDDFPSMMFLPFLLPQIQCSFVPCLVHLADGKFSPLLFQTGEDKPRAPLVNKHLELLPVAFVDQNEEAIRLTKSYFKLIDENYDDRSIKCVRIPEFFTETKINIVKPDASYLYEEDKNLFINEQMAFRPESDEETSPKGAMNLEESLSSIDNVQMEVKKNTEKIFHSAYFSKRTESISEETMPDKPLPHLHSYNCDTVTDHCPPRMSEQNRNNIKDPTTKSFVGDPESLETFVDDRRDQVEITQTQQFILERFTSTPERNSAQTVSVSEVKDESLVPVHQVTNISNNGKRLRRVVVPHTPENKFELENTVGATITSNSFEVKITESLKIKDLKFVSEWLVNGQEIYRVSVLLSCVGEQGPKLQLTKQSQLLTNVSRHTSNDVVLNIAFVDLQYQLHVYAPSEMLISTHDDLEQDWANVLNETDRQREVQLSTHKDKCRVDGCLYIAVTLNGLCKEHGKRLNESSISETTFTEAAISENLEFKNLTQNTFNEDYSCCTEGCTNDAISNDVGLCQECFKKKTEQL